MIETFQGEVAIEIDKVVAEIDNNQEQASTEMMLGDKLEEVCIEEEDQVKGERASMKMILELWNEEHTEADMVVVIFKEVEEEENTMLHKEEAIIKDHIDKILKMTSRIIEAVEPEAEVNSIIVMILI